MGPKAATKSSMNLRSRKMLALKKSAAERRGEAARERRRAAAGTAAAASAGPAHACAGTTCQLCALRFPSIEECAVHILEAHVGGLKLCPRCSRAFTDEAALAEHAARHTRHSLATSCAHCALYFTTAAALERHDYERHEGVGAGAVLTRYFPYFSAHLKTNFPRFMRTARLGRPLHCGLCQHAAADVAACLAHARVACRPRTLVCDTCANVYASEAYFVKHLFKKGSVCRQRNCYPSLLVRRPARTIYCKKCKRKFADRAGYHSHWDNCSVSNHCKKCDLELESLQAYNSHCAEFHRRSLRTLNCTYCRMEFISEKTLARHVRQHEKYSCLRCGKKFRTPKPLLLHIKTSHPDTEPYRCVPCSLNFREGLQFKLHIKTHGDKGYIRFDENHYVTYTEVPPPGPDAPSASHEDSPEKDANLPQDTVVADENVSKDANDTVHVSASHTDANISDGPMFSIEVSLTEDGVATIKEDPNMSSGESKDITGTLETGESKDITGTLETGESKDITRTVEKYTDLNENTAKADDAPYVASTDDTESDSEIEEKKRRKRRKKPSKAAPRIVVRRTDLYPEKTFRCSVCSRRTGSLDSFNRHVTEHFRAGAKQCPRCAKIFRSAAHLARHADTEHKESAPGSRLHSFLKERATRKMAALSAARRALPRPARAAPPPPPFRLRMRRVAAPTVERARGDRAVRADGEVTVTPCVAPPLAGTFGHLTVQRYVESFQPDPETEEKQLTQTGQVKLVTLNKALKVRTVSARDLRQAFSMRMKRYREPKPAGEVRLAQPVPFTRDRSERVRVAVGIADAAAVARDPPLDFGARRECAEPDDTADYFETDEHSVAQVEVLSTPVAAARARRRGAVAAGEGAAGPAAGGKPAYMLQLTDSDPSTADIEKSLAEVCAKLDAPQSTLHIGQLTTQAPYYKIINVQKAKRRRARLQTQADIQRRFEQIKIGAERMVPVNPLEHLLRRAKQRIVDKATVPNQNIHIIPVRTE